MDAEMNSNALVDVLRTVVKIPGVKIDRGAFLQKELSAKKVSQDTISTAISKGIKESGIRIDILDDIASGCIAYQTTICTGSSFVAGIPGGIALLGTVPADVAQYYFHTLSIMQKLAYIYGWPDFELETANDENLMLMILMLGIMSGVSAANQAIKVLAKQFSKQAEKKLVQMALTKGTIYPIVKKIASMLGVNMTKATFAKGVGKIIPIIGGFISGGVTLATFLPSCNKLKEKLREEII